MTSTSFSLTRSAKPDFGSYMAPSFALCERIARQRGDRAAAERNASYFAGYLHDAMGHRADQREF